VPKKTAAPTARRMIMKRASRRRESSGATALGALTSGVGKVGSADMGQVSERLEFRV
jgi:hypothetical protein